MEPEGRVTIRVVIRVESQFAGRIPSCSGEVSLYYTKDLNWLGVTHIMKDFLLT
jgi:hypothetical protein